MPVHIDELESDVTAESAQTPAAGAADSEEPLRIMRVLEQIRRDSRRTSAEGFDD
jgi:hypothetical protein